jgi:cytochrome c oxidase subunit I
MADVISTPLATGEAEHHHNYLTHQRGLWSWLTTVDHKRIGIMYLIGVMTAFMLGGVMALMPTTASSPCTAC